MTMRHMLKPLLLSSITILGVLFSVMYTSCKPDKCKAIACAYGGTCNEGSCTCLAGYGGPNCETVLRKKFVGLWTVKEQGSVTPLRQYPISIENDNAVTGVTIKNLYNYFSSQKIKGYIQGDTLIIPNQQLMGKIIFGKGYIRSVGAPGTNDAITMSYEVIDVATQLVDDFGYYADLDKSLPSEWSKQ